MMNTRNFRGLIEAALPCFVLEEVDEDPELDTSEEELEEPEVPEASDDDDEGEEEEDEDEDEFVGLSFIPPFQQYFSKQDLHSSDCSSPNLS